jgi:arylsulfatase A-like enzyme
VHPGYITHILRDYALEFLHRAAAQEKPFLLIFAPNAPHAPALPAPGDEALYSDLSAYNPPHFNEVDVADKPAWVQALPLLTAEQIAEIQNFRLRQLQSLHALDQAIDSLLNLLAEQNQLDNTFVLYLSDNGYLLGDHRIYDKNFVYEESIHVPFALRYLPLVSEPRLETKLVANIDIAPTIYELAGIPIPHEVDGRSLVPVMIGQSEWRDALLIESWPGRAPYAAVHTENFVYVESDGDRSELYDLMNDPYQLNNQIDNPTYASVIDSLKQRLQELRGNISSVSEFDPFVLQEFILFQNYPNPFNPETSIRFSVPQRSHVSLKIFDVLGKEVATPVNGELDPGLHSVVFDARGLASGLYFYRLLTTSSAYTKSMLLVK